MLSMSNVANSAHAGQYYEQADDYYSRDRSPSQWSGQAAAELGLAGEVKGEDFRAMLDGRLPNGVQLHHAGEGSGRRGGTDMTFSAPKSVSLQALIDGDTRLLQAHETAVGRALEQAEALAACRVTVDGVTSRQTTGVLAVAQFRHDLSRAADPQLHTHAVVLNVTQRADGQWRALDNEPLYRNKMWLGAYYRSELAKEVQALGYELRVTHADGRFELAHVGTEQVKAFSNRSQMIEQALQSQGLSREDASARQLQVAALQTRQGKEGHDRGALLAEWRERAAAAGLHLDRSTAPVARDEMALAQTRAQTADQAVGYAAAHLMEREAVVQRVDIERAALERGTGQTDLAAIRTAIGQAVQRGEFIRDGERYTTPQAQQREREILGMEAAGRGQVAPLMSREAVQQALAQGEFHKLNEDQRGVVAHVLTGQDRVSGVQGGAGTGKTTALRAVRELAEDRGLQLVGVAPSASAARELGRSGMDSQTLAALATRQYPGLNDKTLIVLDEAGMVSARDMHALLKAADQAGARVLLVGDTQQLKAVQAGRPFAQLQQAGMACAQLQEIQRQQEPELKRAVELAATGDAAGSLARLRASVVEIVDHRERHQSIAQDYAALTRDERAATLIVAGTNQNREAINREVREALGRTGQGQVLATLSGKNLTEAQALRTVSYEAGDVVRADRDYKALGLQRGELATVVDGRAGVVTLERADGERVEWRPVNQPHMSGFTRHERELAEGDLVRFTRNDYAQGFVNGERATVLAVEPGRLLLEKLDGSRLVLDPDKPLYLEHGYCQTVHAAQGQTCERVLIESPAGSGVGNESSHYVAISRATHEVRIYTDDAQRLPETLSREDGKTAALDLQPEKDKQASREMALGA
ncbi:conjugative relaxase [Pelomonas sp. P7]|uniref:Conjugative relaxase n=1 Tax=Pelomonas caseinilytica TaxID=2906763 RepID=A0ABS8XBA5_9BURK|nr:MobF family relaxase [Pelomonas sp. P7]MCE4538234.1 conjugative relaxase [Pelomonas sp. P7]